MNDAHHCAATATINPDFLRVVPAEKGLSAAYFAGLGERGETETFAGEELRHIGMPVGGLFCGTLYLGSDSRLWLWDIFNRGQEGIVPKMCRNPAFADAGRCLGWLRMDSPTSSQVLLGALRGSLKSLAITQKLDWKRAQARSQITFQTAS